MPPSPCPSCRNGRPRSHEGDVRPRALAVPPLGERQPLLRRRADAEPVRHVAARPALGTQAHATGRPVASIGRQRRRRPLPARWRRQVPRLARLSGNGALMPSLYEANGHRKYLTADERDRFLKAAEKAERDVRTFCGVLAYTGCRISEALALTADRIDLAAGVIVFESLK